MVQLERDYGFVRGILLDGFILTEGQLRLLDWRSIIRHKGENPEGTLRPRDYHARVEPHLRKPERWSEDVLTRVYDTLVQASRESYCPYGASVMRRPMEFISGRSAVWGGMCHQVVLGAGTSFQSLERLPYQRGLEGVLLVLQTEYRADETEGRHAYVQNLLLIPELDSFDEAPKDPSQRQALLHASRQPVRCHHLSECITRWVTITGFQRKPEELYQDLQAFSDAWYSIMDACVEQYRSGLKCYFPRAVLHIRK